MSHYVFYAIFKLFILNSTAFQASNYNDFGHSWAVAGMCSADECDTPPPGQCTEEEKQAALQICRAILLEKFDVGHV